MNEKVRRPNPLPSALALLWKFVREHLSVKRVLIAALLLPLGLYILDEAFLNNPIIVDSFYVPKRFEDAGFTSEAMSRLIADALLDLEVQANSIMEKDSLALSSDPSPVPDINVPGTGLGIRTLVDVTQQVCRRDPMHIGGAIVLPLTSGSEAANSEVKIILRFVHGRGRYSLVITGGPAEDPRGVATKAAEGILRQINPYLLGCDRLEAKNWADAIKIANEMIGGPPQGSRNIAKAYVLWGNALEHQGKHAEAIPFFEKATTLDPKLALAYSNWGNALSNQGKNAEAIPFFEKAVCLDPKFALAHNNLGYALASQGKNAEAISFFEKATTLDPKSALAYNNWGEALANQGKNAEAIPFFEKATTLDPKYAFAYNNWGLALANQGKNAEAVPFFEKATTLYALDAVSPYVSAGTFANAKPPVDPNFAVAYNNWGNALVHQGKNAEAVPFFEKATILDPEYALAYNNWGYALASQGKNAEAIPFYEKATSLDPKNVLAYNNWGKALDLLGNHSEAEAKRRKAAEVGQSK
jgi:superkiller protein 3